MMAGIQGIHKRMHLISMNTSRDSIVIILHTIYTIPRDPSNVTHRTRDIRELVGLSGKYWLVGCSYRVYNGVTGAVVCGCKFLDSD